MPESAAMTAALVPETLAEDRRARILALDSGRSFIVQAPAGSGKTELLIQRLLAVLAQAEHPSEVLAITFTNKAAGEMRERLHAALTSAQQSDSDSLLPVERTRRELALAVLARNNALNWHLLERPDALMIDTFDAFCARLAARAPLQQVADNGALAPVAESLDAVYRDAARTALFEPDLLAESTTLLSLAANRVDEVVGLIADLLARRAQWLGEALDVSDDAISRLSATLAAEVEHSIRAVADAYSSIHDSDIRSLAAYTAETFALGSRDESDVREREQLAQFWPPGASAFRSIAERSDQL